MPLYQARGYVKYQDNWVYLKTSISIVKYYNWWIRKLTWKKATPPFYGAHVTVVSGKYENVTKHKYWKKYDNKKVLFEYSSVIYKNHEGYYFLYVNCPFLTEIRREFGLSDCPKWPFHLTVGYIENEAERQRLVS